MNIVKSSLNSLCSNCLGKDLWVMAVSSHSPDKHVLLRPETKYVGNIHGNEVSLCLSVISYSFSTTIPP